MLLRSVSNDLQPAMELVVPDLCTIAKQQLVKLINVTVLSRCRMIPLVVEFASYHGHIGLTAEDEDDYRELLAGGVHARSEEIDA